MGEFSFTFVSREILYFNDFSLFVNILMLSCLFDFQFPPAMLMPLETILVS